MTGGRERKTYLPEQTEPSPAPSPAAEVGAAVAMEGTAEALEEEG